MKLEDLANKEIEITSDGLLKVVEKKKGKFVPKVEETYWYVRSNGNVDYYRYTNDKVDEYLLNHHPVFRTEEEAYEYKDYLELLDKYKYNFSDEEWLNGDILKWFVYYTHYNKLLDVRCNNVSKYPLTAYFKSEEDAEDFIEEAGKDNIKKFMFDVWE